MQAIVDYFSMASDTFALKIKLLSQPPPGLTDDPAVIRVHGEALNTSAHFTYLGTTETNSDSADLEVER